MPRGCQSVSLSESNPAPVLYAMVSNIYYLFVASSYRCLLRYCIFGSIRCWSRNRFMLAWSGNRQTFRLDCDNLDSRERISVKVNRAAKIQTCVNAFPWHSFFLVCLVSRLTRILHLTKSTAPSLLFILGYSFNFDIRPLVGFEESVENCDLWRSEVFPIVSKVSYPLGFKEKS